MQLERRTDNKLGLAGCSVGEPEGPDNGVGHAALPQRSLTSKLHPRSTFSYHALRHCGVFLAMVPVFKRP